MNVNLYSGNQILITILLLEALWILGTSLISLGSHIKLEEPGIALRHWPLWILCEILQVAKRSHPRLRTRAEVAQTVKNLPVMQETWVWSLGWEDPLEKIMATHSSILAWTIPWTEEPGGLYSIELQRVGHDSAATTHRITCLTVDNSCCFKTH